MNVSGLPKGVVKNGRGFQAQATHMRKKYYLGYYDNPEEAGAAYVKFRERFPNSRSRFDMDELFAELESAAE